METATPQGRELHHFLLLDREQQRGAIIRLAAAGYTDNDIASATRLSVEMVRSIIGERHATPA